MSGLSLDEALRVLDRTRGAVVTGRVTELIGLVVRATAPGARVGELVIIERQRGGHAASSSACMSSSLRPK